MKLQNCNTSEKLVSRVSFSTGWDFHPNKSKTQKQTCRQKKPQKSCLIQFRLGKWTFKRTQKQELAQTKWSNRACLVHTYTNQQFIFLNNQLHSWWYRRWETSFLLYTRQPRSVLPSRAEVKRTQCECKNIGISSSYQPKKATVAYETNLNYL